MRDPHTKFLKQADAPIIRLTRGKDLIRPRQFQDWRRLAPQHFEEISDPPTHIRGVKMSRLERVFDNTYDACDGVEICSAQLATKMPQFTRRPRRGWGPHP